jgi:hypothetical protein
MRVIVFPLLSLGCAKAALQPNPCLAKRLHCKCGLATIGAGV